MVSGTLGTPAAGGCTPLDGGLQSCDVYYDYATAQGYTPNIVFSEDTCQRETYSYDTNPYDSNFSQYAQGRLTAVQYKGGYNASSNPTCNTTFTEMYSYSQAGAPLKKRLQITRSSLPLSTLNLDATHTYDNEGRVTATQYPSAWNGSSWVAGPNLGNSFDSMGHLSSLTDLASQTAIISAATYGPAGQLLSMTGVNGAPSETRTYNSIGQMTQLTSGSLNVQYNYSATQNNGKITSETDVVSGEQIAYTYDSLNRLASATSSVNPGWGQSYTYDGFGNLTNQTVTKGTAPSLSVSYNPATNRQTGECADANGNLCGSGYSYDVENRLSYTGSARYSYAPGNKRVWRGVWSGSTQTVDEVTYWGVNGQKLVTYQLSVVSSQLVATATGTNQYFGGKLIKNTGGYVTPDRLGSIGKYFPYGQERPSATTDGKEKFATYFRDSETGLDYANARYHQPGMGRFMTADPYKASAGASDPGSWNRYAYTGGDPINRMDRTGLDWTNNYAYEAWSESYFTGSMTPGQAEAMYGEQQYCADTGSYCPPGDAGGCYANSLYGGGGCYGPDPTPDPPPPPPPPAPPECFAELKYRAVNTDGNVSGVAVHTFWYVQDSTGSQFIVHGGPQDSYLRVWVDQGSPGADNPSAATSWSSGLSSMNCDGVDRLLDAARGWNQSRFHYDFYWGPNSNTAARYLGGIGGFNPSKPLGAVAWDADLFGPTLGGDPKRPRRRR